MSFWDDVIIGKGETGVATVKVFEIEGDHGISANRVCFRCSDIFMDMGMTIMRDTPEGARLQKMIDKKKSYTSIKKYLSKLILKKSSVDVIFNKIEEVKEKAFKEGKEAKAEELREILGIREY